jgi:diguanylate cyclase (GGDEF)-like protein
MKARELENQNRSQYVLLIEEKGLTKSVILDQDIYSIGRKETNSIVLNSRQVSRTHAIIRRQRQGDKFLFFIEDGDLNGNPSFNGIFFQKKKINKHQLQHGDIINIGTEVTLTFYVSYDLDYCSLPLTKEKFEAKIDVDKQTNFSEEKEDSTSFAAQKYKSNKKPNRDCLKLMSILELCPNPIIEIDYQGNLTYTNPSSHLIFSDIEQLQNKHPLFSQIIEDKDKYKGEIIKREIQIRKEIYEQYIHYLADQNFIRFYIFDITQRKELEKKLKYNAYYDSLTDLPNRLFFDITLKKTIANARRKEHKFVIFFLDIDKFKYYNDNLGHKAGDQLLSKFADKLKNSVREEDMVFRWGGDEFTILVPEVNDLKEATRVAERIIQVMKEPILLYEKNYDVTTSIGISIYPEDGSNEAILIKNADAALYKAKLKGKNQYYYHTPQLNSQSSYFLTLEHDLYQAIEDKQFFLNYQPQINLKTGKIECFEALLRWHHPTKGILMPNEFISIAEETGLIIPISEWIIDTVCQQNKIWYEQNNFDLRIGINISTSLFKKFNLAKTVFKAIEKHNLPPHLLEFEIKENIMNENIQAVKKNFVQLLNNGVRITIDDFGISCSSLINLKKIPFHYLKICQTLIAELKDDVQDRAIISAIVTMAKAFNLKVVAEGVENQEKWDLLSELGCDYIQGYLLSKPLSKDQVIPFLQKSYGNLLVRKS